MKLSELKLGHILAFLKSEGSGNHKAGKFRDMTEESQAYVHFIREKKDGNPQQYLFPNPESNSTAQFENELEDYFVTSLLGDSKQKPERDYCRRLYESLNDSFLCFQSFVGVMKDYYHTSQALSVQSKEKE